MRQGTCYEKKCLVISMFKALFNGGNHTGTVPIDPSQGYKNSPKILAQRSGVPHMVRGRYMFRVDDVVRPAGCSNKTGGTCKLLKINYFRLR